MQLPDEAISYDPQQLLCPALEEWTAAAELRARHFVSPSRFRDFHQRLLQVRGQVAADRENRNPTPEYLPLESGFINLPQEQLDGFRRKQEASDLGKVISLSLRFREDCDRVVVLGTGGAYFGAQALFRAMKSTHHNELPPESRLGVPRIYFEGNSADNDALQELLELLQITCVDPDRREERWAVVSISKTGASLEPGIALRAFRREAAEFYGLRSPALYEMFAAIGAPSSRLLNLHKALGVGDDALLQIPENVGERFGVFTPAGLLPAAIMGLDVRALLLGAAAMTKRFLEDPVERNPVLQFAGLNYLLHEESNKPLRVLSIWSRKLEAIGTWYEHLVSESLGKQGRGPTPLTMVQTRDLYSRGQQMREGPRDRAITNLMVKTPQAVPIAVQMADHNEDDLNRFNRRTVPEMQRAAQTMLNRVNYDNARPSADLMVPVVSEHTLGQLLQMLMLATVVEARLMGVNPYSQPGLEASQRDWVEQVLANPPEATLAQESRTRPGQ